MWYLFYVFIIITGWPVFYVLLRPKVHYDKNADRRKCFKGKTVVISNHTSVFDYVPMIMITVPRFPYTIGAEILFEKNFFFTLFLKCMRVIKVDRNTHKTKATQKAIDAINSGKLLYVFPEGRIPESGEKGSLLPFHTGFVRMTLATGAKVVPVYTNGKLFCKERNRLMVGEPVDVRKLYDEKLSEDDNVHNIAEFFRDKIKCLGEELAKRTE